MTKKKNTTRRPAMRPERDLSVHFRMSAEERDKLHAIAADRDLPASALVRHWLREAYAQRFGNTPPAEISTGGGAA